jgi:hypothetical protein
MKIKIYLEMRYNTHIKMTDIDDKLSRVGKVRSQTPIMYMELGTMPPVGRKHMRLNFSCALAHEKF